MTSWALAALLAATATPSPSSKRCSREDATAAGEQASQLRTWRDIHESYRRYGHCDDGAIAEGYSDSLSLTLLERWSDAADLAKRMATDPGFETFVVKHIDDTVPAPRLAAIEANARERCPAGAERLCARIRDGIDALKRRYR